MSCSFPSSCKTTEALAASGCMKKIGWKLFWWDCNYLTQRIINSTFSVCSWCCEEHIFPCLWIQMRLNASTPTNTHSRLCLNHKIQSTIVNQHRSNRIAPRFGSLTVRESAPNPPRLPNRAKKCIVASPPQTGEYTRADNNKTRIKWDTLQIDSKSAMKPEQINPKTNTCPPNPHAQIKTLELHLVGQLVCIPQRPNRRRG